MKKATLLLVLSLGAALLFGCSDNNPTPAPPSPGPNDQTTTTVYRMADEFPTAAGTVNDGVWAYYTVNHGSQAKGDYTAITTVADQASLGSLGISAGEGALGSASAIAASGKDVAYGFTAPRDGVVKLTSETLLRTEAGGAALSVYKNGVRIWPLSAGEYAVPTSEKAAMLSLETAVKAGDILFFRISAAQATPAKLAISPVVSYLQEAYTTEKDLELTRPNTADAKIENAGATLSDSSLAATGRQPSDTVIELSGKDFEKALTRATLQEGATYKITSDEPLTISLSRGTYDGKNCIVYAPCGITFDAKAGIALTNLTVLDGLVTVTGGTDLTLTQMELNGGLRAEEGCTGLRLEDCRITAVGDAFVNRAASATVVNCYFAGKTAMLDEAESGCLFENCVFYGEEVAVTLHGEHKTIWYSTIRGDVTTSGKSENLLVAMNRFENLGSVTYRDTHNSVVLLNEVEGVHVQNSTNAYVCSNTLYGTMSFDKVNYLLATRNNTFGKIEAAAIANFNGDNITDVDARVECGVNEDLLPHINKDAFINMERMEYVRLSDGSRMSISAYINQKSQSNGMLIIAPGAYSTANKISITKVNNFTVYAYGVLYEKDDFFDQVFYIKECENYQFRGLTVDMVLNGCGHMVVLNKSNGIVTYRAAAGMLENLTDAKYFDEGGNGISFMGYHAGEDFPYADISLRTLTFNSTTKLLTSVPSASVYAAIQPGDIITCRANGNNVAYLYGNTALQFEDVTILSGSIRCFWEDAAKVGTTLNRVMISPAPAKVIDQSLYEEYIALGEKYGVDTGVYIDAFGNYRGAPVRTVTQDTTHSSNSSDGMKVTSSIFEGIADDGTNHQGTYGRLAGYDAASGTVTYKVALTSYGYKPVCTPFEVGDRVYIYSSNGKLICDTLALSATVQLSQVDGFMHYTVKIDPTAFDEDLIRGYDLTSNGAIENILYIDNRSHNGDGFVYDNILVQSTRSRGFLVKSGNNVIKHCTFRNIGMEAIALIFEPEWGEAGICDNTLIAYNYIENTGYYKNTILYSPIPIQGLSTAVEDDCLPYRNIQIVGNVVRNRATYYALYINSAMDLTVKDNDFGDPTFAEDLMNHPSVYINYAKNISFDHNTYSEYAFDITESILALNYLNVDGSDINGALHADPVLEENEHRTLFVENLPYINNDNTLTHVGAWRVGYANTFSLNSFKPFDCLQDSSWYTDSANPMWSGSGGIQAQKAFRFGASGKSNVAVQYTAEYSGTVALRLSAFDPPYTDGQGSADGYFAIFLNGTMVWPKEGGSYTNGKDWMTIKPSTSAIDMYKAISKLSLHVEKGDTISFVAMQKNAWSAFSAQPAVFYTAKDE